MKKYIELNTKTRNATHLKIEVYYHLGGYNYFTYRKEARGYYISVSPVEHSNINGVVMESYTAFSGSKYLLKEVSRKSAKAEAEAEKIAEGIERDLIRTVCINNNLEIPEL